jgi:hypothetical protein
MEFILFAVLYLKKKRREATLFAKRVPTLPKDGTGYLAPGGSFRSPAPSMPAGKGPQLPA